MSLFKIFKESGLHYDHQYVPGLNELNGKFAKTGSCVKGGFYYINAKHILDYILYGTILRLIEIPSNAQTREDGYKWRSDKIILLREYSLFDISTFEMLIKLGADVPKECIIFAATHGKLDLLIYLIELRLNKKDYFTAFESATEHGQLNIILHIIDYIDRTTDSYFMVIHKAIKNGHIDVVKYLLKLPGVHELESIFLCDNVPFILCAQNDRLEILKYLIEKYPSFICYHEIITNAVKNGHLSIVKHYQQHILPNNKYATVAAIRGHKSLVEFFVELSCDIIPDIIKSLYEIIRQKDSSIAMYLLEKSHHMDNEIIANSITSSVEYGHVDVLKFLIGKCEENVFKIISSGSIIIAARNNHLDMIKFLFESGYKPSIFIIDESLKNAAGNGHNSMVQYLIKLGARVWSMKLTNAMLKAAMDGNSELIKILVENNLCMNKIQHTLYVACKHDHIDIVEYLMPKVLKTENYIRNAINVAIEHDHTDIVEFLTNNIN